MATCFLPAWSRLAGARPPARFRIGLVFDVGGRGDKRPTTPLWEGISRAGRELGVTTEILEPSGAEDREAAMRRFADRGFDPVIGVGFIFSTDVNVVAAAFPRTRFACIDYAPRPDGAVPANVTGLIFREEEGSFLVGAVAGLMSKTRHLVSRRDGHPPHPPLRGRYRAGVHEVCPACLVHVAYAGTTPDAFRDPVKGKALAIGEISAGADVLYHASGTTGHGVFEAARDMDVKAIGVDSDQHDDARHGGDQHDQARGRGGLRRHRRGHPRRAPRRACPSASPSTASATTPPGPTAPPSPPR